jgi:hypothetical protein
MVNWGFNGKWKVENEKPLTRYRLKTLHQLTINYQLSIIN